MFKIIFLFHIFLTCYGFLYDYLNFVQSSNKHLISASPGANGYDRTNSMDGNLNSFRSDSQKNSINNVFYKVTIHHRTETQLRKIRILKLREEKEVLSLSIINHNRLKYPDVLMQIDYNQGWNEFDFPGNKSVFKIEFRVKQSNYTDLEIAELQVFFTFKIFHTCLEWFKHAEIKSYEHVFLFNVKKKKKENVARIESGSSCSSSSGQCINAIKDSIVFIDDIWKPSIDDRSPFLHIQFFSTFNIIDIKVNQPMENTINSIAIKNDENLIEMIVNKTSNWTEIDTDISTKWIRFQIDLKNGDIFKGFYEVEANAYKPTKKK